MQALPRVATFARLAAIGAVLAIVGLLGVRPALDPTGNGVRAMGPLPACRYDDILTSPRGYDDWSITLVDTILRVQKAYAPPDLVSVRDAGIPGRGQVRAIVIEDLRAMGDAARAADAAIGSVSAYRSYAEQKLVFDDWVSRLGYQRALELSARPGHSEHQLGVTIDFRSHPADDLELAQAWAGTPAGMWMKAHSWEYGFVMSYPKGEMDVVCYDWEPWHFRYVGRELAADVQASGLTLREYLWANFTTTVVPPPTPKPTAKPAATQTPSPTPTVAPSPTAAASPSPTATPVAVPTPTPVAAPSVAPTPGSTGAPPAPERSFWETLAANPIALAGAGIAAGTIVLAGVVLAVARRGRSGVGL